MAVTVSNCDFTMGLGRAGNGWNDPTPTLYHMTQYLFSNYGSSPDLSTNLDCQSGQERQGLNPGRFQTRSFHCGVERDGVC